jgi:hypothetical protein
MTCNSLVLKKMVAGSIQRTYKHKPNFWKVQHYKALSGCQDKMVLMHMALFQV